jgi:hypothetical protein
MPPEMVVDGTPGIAPDANRAVDEGILVYFDIAAVEYENRLVAIFKNISRAYGSFGDFEEKTVEIGPHFREITGFPVVGTDVFHPVVDEPAIHISHIIPDPVRKGQVIDQIVKAGSPVGLVKDLHGSRIISVNVFNVILGEFVLFK